MHNNTDTLTTARNLYGDGWHDLPAFAQEAAADFVAELLDLTWRQADDGDRAHECADAGVPIYRSELLALLADVDAADAILRAADDLGGMGTDDGMGTDVVTRLVSLGVYGILSSVFGMMVYALNDARGFVALGLDDDAAELAFRLWPEWSGTVRELVAAAPALAAETAEVTR